MARGAVNFTVDAHHSPHMFVQQCVMHVQCVLHACHGTLASVWFGCYWPLAASVLFGFCWLLMLVKTTKIELPYNHTAKPC